MNAPSLPLMVWPAGNAEPALIGVGDAKRRGVLPWRSTDGELLALVADSRDGHLLAWLDAHLTEPYRLMEVEEAALIQVLTDLETGSSALSGLAASVNSEVSSAGGADTISRDSLEAEVSPVVRLVNSTLYDGLRGGASDIHLEATADGLSIRFRIDGVLVEMGEIKGRATAEQAVSRLKVLADLDIAESRIPQDGRFKARIGEREVDFRVSVMPSLHGEDAVLRILDRQHLTADLEALSLESLGFDAATRAHLRQLVRRPHGMVLVTGPTGSGKTTTLYAALREIHDRRDKIVTIEDPVEYQLHGVLQIPVNEKKGLTFARGLRSILRHDPDRIMVGEIRDAETAAIAVQAALTGHLVLTTVHANSVFDVLQRFTHMGVDAYALASALAGIVGQRLLRLTCQACAGNGCDACRGTGYRGRRAVAEILLFDDDLREAVIARAPLRQLKEMAAARGLVPLREAAMALADRGVTRREEVLRVTL